MKRKVFAMLAVIIFFMNVEGADAGSRKDVLNTMTKVLPVVKYRIIYQAADLEITVDDIKNGYVDINNALVISMKTNSDNGCLVAFFFDEDHIKGLTVFDNNNPYRVTESGDEVHMPYKADGSKTRELNIRFYLLRGVKPGKYLRPFNVVINAI